MNRNLLKAAALLVAALAGVGCVTTIDKLDPNGSLDVAVECKMHAYGPHVPVPIKFWVDITNKSGKTVSLERLRIELQATPAKSPDWIALKQSWTYRNAPETYLANGKRLTIPIVPERGDEKNMTGSEFPLELLPAGDYSIVAVVNGKHISRPCPLRIERPDTRRPGLRAPALELTGKR